MDLLTWYDRVSGGASFLVSMPARPGTLPTITAVNMDVFLPIIPQEQPKTSIVFARMVQSFAEEIGLPTIRRMNKAKSTTAQRLPIVVANTGSSVDIQPLIPPSETPWHRFYGRDVGVLERLIAEQFPDVSAVQKLPSMILRPQALLPPLAPKGSAPHATVGSSGLQKQVPWTAGDILHLAEQFGRCNERDEAGLRAIAEQVSTRLPDIFKVITDLELRVEALETVKQTQLEEIGSLRQALQESFDQHRGELIRINEELSAPSVPELPRPSLTSVRSGRIRALATSNSILPVSSIIDSAPPPSIHNARYEERKTVPIHAATSPPRSASAPNNSNRPSGSRSGSPNVSLNVLQVEEKWSKGRIYGPNTEQVLQRHKLPRRVHTILRNLEKTRSQENLMQAVRATVPNCSQDLARELVDAMKNDRDLSSRA
ncbi:hypothetical protein GSI_04601 [Ganoderma sinense ZZ0214-1]|uniref:Uncharacterized protein n=1 Tax=Ganoderma sinense ZZ0214-1 TaxID=1077348 RepID=A0A2G8SHC6_9APHY|nr:hypothetical protein GSI_04601 [Ganoderma sinense ZZ0214-1]